MRYTVAAVWTAAILSGLWVLGGCAKPEMAAVSVTEWTQTPSGAYVVDSGRVFHGIGKASGLRSAALLRATADNQAQAEMARVIESFLSQLTSAAGFTPTHDQDREMIGALTESILKHARISDHRFKDPGGPLYALCRLELTSLKQVIQSAEGLDESFRKNMLAQADQVYAGFSARRP